MQGTDVEFDFRSTRLDKNAVYEIYSDELLDATLQSLFKWFTDWLSGRQRTEVNSATI